MVDEILEQERLEEEAAKEAAKMALEEENDQESNLDDASMYLLSEPAAEDDDAGLGSDLVADEEDFD
jgi:hypothetical protein